jgi:hypothetical protein
MLATDSLTIAVEVPIWLAENDITALEREFQARGVVGQGLGG